MLRTITVGITGYRGNANGGFNRVVLIRGTPQRVTPLHSTPLRHPSCSHERLSFRPRAAGGAPATRKVGGPRRVKRYKTKIVRADIRVYRTLYPY